MRRYGPKGICNNTPCIIVSRERGRFNHAGKLTFPLLFRKEIEQSRPNLHLCISLDFPFLISPSIQLFCPLEICERKENLKRCGAKTPPSCLLFFFYSNLFITDIIITLYIACFYFYIYLIIFWFNVKTDKRRVTTPSWIIAQKCLLLDYESTFCVEWE